MTDTYHREQRAAVIAALLYPVWFALVMLHVLLPMMQGMMEATP
jgi:hypothetical protein